MDFNRAVARPLILPHSSYKKSKLLQANSKQQLICYSKIAVEIKYEKNKSVRINIYLEESS